jgi:hypothetical protein
MTSALTGSDACNQKGQGQNGIDRREAQGASGLCGSRTCRCDTARGRGWPGAALRPRAWWGGVGGRVSPSPSPRFLSLSQFHNFSFARPVHIPSARGGWRDPPRSLARRPAHRAGRPARPGFPGGPARGEVKRKWTRERKRERTKERGTENKKEAPPQGPSPLPRLPPPPSTPPASSCSFPSRRKKPQPSSPAPPPEQGILVNLQGEKTRRETGPHTHAIWSILPSLSPLLPKRPVCHKKSSAVHWVVVAAGTHFRLSLALIIPLAFQLPLRELLG